MKRIAMLATCISAVLTAATAAAQTAPENYPNKTVRFICPFPRVNDAINRVLAQPEVKDYLNKQALVASGGTPEAFTARIKSELTRWGKVVKDTGAKAD